MSKAEGSKDGRLRCPRCGLPLEGETVRAFGPDIHIDVCRHCQGTWLDEGELAPLIDDRRLAKYLTGETEGQPRSPMGCPSCGGEMALRRAVYVEVDVCTSCGGVWLDMGEEEVLRAVPKGELPGYRKGVMDVLREEDRARHREAAFYGFMRGLGERMDD